MKRSLLNHLVLAFFAAGIGAATAGEKVATVTETVNEVDHGLSSSSATNPAHVGTSLQDGDYLKTGAKSLAEVQLANKTVTRMGANTIFNYSVANNEVDLQGGTILFSKPKDGQQLNIKTAAVTAAVVGTTGFIQSTPNGFLFGLIEGHSHLSAHGHDYVVGPGQILVVIPGHQPMIFSFNVPQMVGSSPLFTSFHHHLPNWRFIEAEIAAYLDDVSRGFIVPVSGPIITYEYLNNIPFVDYVAFDSAQSAQGMDNQQYPTPTPSGNNDNNNTCDNHHPSHHDCHPRWCEESWCRPRCGRGSGGVSSVSFSSESFSSSDKGGKGNKPQTSFGNQGHSPITQFSVQNKSFGNNKPSGNQGNQGNHSPSSPSFHI